MPRTDAVAARISSPAEAGRAACAGADNAPSSSAEAGSNEESTEEQHSHCCRTPSSSRGSERVRFGLDSPGSDPDMGPSTPPSWQDVLQYQQMVMATSDRRPTPTGSPRYRIERQIDRDSKAPSSPWHAVQQFVQGIGQRPGSGVTTTTVLPQHLAQMPQGGVGQSQRSSPAPVSMDEDTLRF